MANQEKFSFSEGELLLIDKPQGWTSFDAVNKIRALLRRNLGLKGLKVGHAGTLDPMATGLLIVCTGRMTKKIGSLMDSVKGYSGTLVLGSTTPSFDLETPVNRIFDTAHISPGSIREAAVALTGTYEQVPPAYSAKRIAGRRAYEMARKNKDVEIKAVQVTVHDFQVDAIRLPEVDFSVTCSKGTYIRALARDFGERLGSGAHLVSLRRTRIGEYMIGDALSISQFEALVHTLSEQRSISS
jgi:tRNA pseudouridine55 synthase